MPTRKRLAAGGNEQRQRDVASEPRGGRSHLLKAAELRFFGELKDANLHPEVRRFYEEEGKASDQDIRVLAAAREREGPERGRGS